MGTYISGDHIPDVGYMTMNGNITETAISVTNTPVKVSGVTTNSSVTQGFDHTDGRLTKSSLDPEVVKVVGVCSLSSGNNNQVGFYISKNGVEIDESETYMTTNAGGKLENATVQTITSLDKDDYIEFMVENNTATNNITVEYLSLTITTIG